MSPPYINSPFLTLDDLDDTAENNNTVEKSTENKAEFNARNSNQIEFTTETSNENRTDEYIEEPIQSDEERVVFTEISSRKRAKPNLPLEYRELLQRLKNATFDVEQSSEVFVELKQSLTEMLQKLYSVTKKEKGVTLNIPSNSNTNSSKFNVVDVPPRKKKNCSCVGEKYEKIRAAAQVSVQTYTPAKSNIEDEQVLERDLDFKARDVFTVQNCDIDLTVDSEDETNSEEKVDKIVTSPREKLSFRDLKTISDSQMLTNNVVNLLQKMLKQVFVDAMGLQDPVRSQNSVL